jgi:hypothetical protein
MGRAGAVPALVLLIAVGWSGAAAARERPRAPEPPPPDPVLQTESNSYFELDLGMVVHDLLGVYLDALRESEPGGGEPGGAESGGAEFERLSPAERADRIEALAGAIGLSALERLRVESKTAIDRESTRITLTTDPREDAGLIGSLLAIPPARARFGRYLSEDDVAILVSLPTWAPSFAAGVEFLDRPEVDMLFPETKGQAGTNSLLASLHLKEELLPFLSGELDYVQFAASADIPAAGEVDNRGGASDDRSASGAGGAGHRSRSHPDVALVIGAHDGAALRDKILDLSLKVVGMVSGRTQAATGPAPDSSAQSKTQQQAAMMAMASGLISGLRSLPSETHGDFKFQKLPGGAALATSPDWLIITTAPARLEALVERPVEGMEIPKSRAYVRLDGGVVIKAMLAHGAHGARRGRGDARAEDPGRPAAELHDRIAAILADAAKQGQTGTFEMTATSRADRFTIDLRRSGRVSRTGYAVLREVVAALPALQAAQAKRNVTEKAKAGIKEDVSQLDDALTRYGQEHHGTFPEDPRELVREGYLDAFPDLQPTPPGSYLERGYSYIPLRSDDGTVLGCYLFVYGGGEGTGYDVFTPENLSALDHFAIGKDGEPDGVANFAYEGSAERQVEMWRQMSE